MAYKLLLADDSQTIQKVVDLVLNREGFDILSCKDGEEALEAIRSVMPDIVLADIEMPKLNGYQLCERIKGDPETVHIPVILLAGAFEPFDEDYANSVGANDFIMKPFESQELVSKVKSLLVSPEVIKKPAAEPAAVTEELASTAAAAAPTAKETEWFESYPLGLQEVVKAQGPEEAISAATVSSDAIGDFDAELKESLKKLEEDSGMDVGEIEEVVPDGEPALTAATRSTARETDWFEGSSLGQQEVVKAQEPEEAISAATVSSDAIGDFDAEFKESLKKLEEESGLDVEETDKVIPEEISIEEISKMVKEAIGEPSVAQGYESVAEHSPDAAAVEDHEPAPAELKHSLSEPVRRSVDISKEEINATVLASISAILPTVIRESVERAVSDTIPNLLEEALRESIKELSGYLHTAVHAEIKKVVPGLADAIIKQEIEKITSELT